MQHTLTCDACMRVNIEILTETGSYNRKKMVRIAHRQLVVSHKNNLETPISH